jgi:ectoine hydroxylase-related dioxygenase (phytanoyl-CoA dioxygenase family)
MVTIQDIPLISNGFILSRAPERLGHLTPTPADTPINAIREQFRAQGYVWLRGFFDCDEVLAVRERFYSTQALAGMTDPTHSFREAIFSGHVDQTGQATRLMLEFVRLAAYESFCFHPKLWQFYEALLNGAVYLHKRKIVRSSYPDEAATTGAHYDLTYLRGGTDSVCTSWIPLGDCPLEMGGLMYLEGSDAVGRALEAELAAKSAHLTPEQRISAYNKNMSASGWITKDVNAIADKFDGRWLVADYAAGDMVIHSAYMIHASTQNVDPQRRMRLSTDIRYQRIREEIDVRWQNHWSLDDML